MKISTSLLESSNEELKGSHHHLNLRSLMFHKVKNLNMIFIWLFLYRDISDSQTGGGGGGG